MAVQSALCLVWFLTPSLNFSTTRLRCNMLFGRIIIVVNAIIANIDINQTVPVVIKETQKPCKETQIDNSAFQEHANDKTKDFPRITGILCKRFLNYIARVYHQENMSV